MTDKKVNIGILGAMDSEVEALIAKLENKYEEVISGIKFNIGSLYGKRVAGGLRRRHCSHGQRRLRPGHRGAAAESRKNENAQRKLPKGRLFKRLSGG